MIKAIKRLFSRKKKTHVTLYPFAVELEVRLDNNTILVRLVATIHAKSKRDAKEQIRSRAFVKVGSVANRAQISRVVEQVKNQRHAQKSGTE